MQPFGISEQLDGREATNKNLLRLVKDFCRKLTLKRSLNFLKYLPEVLGQIIIDFAVDLHGLVGCMQVADFLQMVKPQIQFCRTAFCCYDLVTQHCLSPVFQHSIDHGDDCSGIALILKVD